MHLPKKRCFNLNILILEIFQDFSFFNILRYLTRMLPSVIPVVRFCLLPPLLLISNWSVQTQGSCDCLFLCSFFALFSLCKYCCLVKSAIKLSSVQTQGTCAFVSVVDIVLVYAFFLCANFCNWLMCPNSRWRGVFVLVSLAFKL